MNRFVVRTMLLVAAATTGSGSVCLADSPGSTAPKAQPAPSPPPADNTAVNKQDRQDDQLTADQQKNDKSDLEMAREIRRSVVSDKSLSTRAHNVKIIAKDGVVTLKGPVRTVAEKSAIEEKAASVSGAGKVRNEIEIVP